jgi:hypothetical protein
MNAHPTIEAGRQPLHLPLRRISVSTMYAWTRVIEAYGKLHPDHQVQIFYRHTSVRDLKLLVKHSPQLDPHGFEVRVETPNEDRQDVSRLVSLLEDATGPALPKFLTDKDPNAWFMSPVASSQAS